MNILFTICGRAGSKGFKNKNLKELSGVPLVYYTLASIIEYKNKHPENQIEVVANTDSYPLVKLLQQQKDIKMLFVERRDELAGDTTPKIAVIQDTYKRFAYLQPNVVVDLDITSPYRTVSDIDKIILEYSNGRYDVVFSVVQARRNPYFNMVEKKEDGYYKKICNSSYTARQQAPVAYELNASIYAYNPLFLAGTIDRTILDYRCGISIMQDYLVLDIDSEEDFEMMQYLHDYYCKANNELDNIYLLAKGMLNSISSQNK